MLSDFQPLVICPLLELELNHVLRVGEIWFTTNHPGRVGCVLLSEEVGDACWVGWTIGLSFGGFKMYIWCYCLAAVYLLYFYPLTKAFKFLSTSSTLSQFGSAFLTMVQPHWLWLVPNLDHVLFSLSVFKHCYRLNICSPDSYVEILTSNVMVLGGGGFGKWLRHEGGEIYFCCL